MTIGIDSYGGGDYHHTRRWLAVLASASLFADMHRWGEIGVNALQSATPIDTGLAQESWGYRITKDQYGPGIEWFNTDIEKGVNVIILIQYGHATGTGGYVQGRDIINPTIQPIFDKIIEDIGGRLSSG